MLLLDGVDGGEVKETRCFRFLVVWFVSLLLSSPSVLIAADETTPLAAGMVAGADGDVDEAGGVAGVAGVEGGTEDGAAADEMLDVLDSSGKKHG